MASSARTCVAVSGPRSRTRPRHRPRDLIARDFTAQHVNARWCGDITYLPVGGRWLYLATVINIASRRLVGWSIAPHMRTSLVIDALTAAVPARGGQVSGVVFHSDRGAQGGFNWSPQHLG